MLQLPVSDTDILKQLQEPAILPRLEELISLYGKMRISNGTVTVEQFLPDVVQQLTQYLIFLNIKSSKDNLYSKKELSDVLGLVAKDAQDCFDLPVDLSLPSISYEGLFSRSNLNDWGALGIGAGVAGYALSFGWPFMLVAIPSLAMGGLAVTQLRERRARWQDDLLGCYDRLARHIDVKRGLKERLFGIIAHEYAHHVEYEVIGTSCFQSKIFLEGYAEGFARILSSRYAVAQQNLHYSFYPSCNRAIGLEVVYRWLCSHHGKTPKEFSVSLKNGSKVPDYYSFGNAFFTLLEAAEGEGIYKAILHKEYGEA